MCIRDSIVDVDFSAQMEKNLDKVESGKADWRKTVDDFYQGFEASLEQCHCLFTAYLFVFYFAAFLASITF